VEFQYIDGTAMRREQVRGRLYRAEPARGVYTMVFMSQPSGGVADYGFVTDSMRRPGAPRTLRVMGLAGVVNAVSYAGALAGVGYEVDPIHEAVMLAELRRRERRRRRE